jgi:adenosylcobinamide-phosphate synthase
LERLVAGRFLLSCARIVIDLPKKNTHHSAMLISDAYGSPGGVGAAYVLLAALALDAVLGDPQWLYRRLPHPVVLMGRLIGRMEGVLHPGEKTRERSRGVLLVGLVVAIAATSGWAIGAGLRALAGDGAWLAEALVASTLLAFRGLYDRVAAVARALRRDLSAGRQAVGEIVGRDPAVLDECGVGRAAVESLAENFSDGVVAPVLCYLLLGLPGLFAYKAINTLDSMVGYETERYRRFGWAAAKLDDLVNWPAARLTAAIFTVAAGVSPGMSAGGAARAVMNDASRHRSPNAGWCEAAAAGALGLMLGGPRCYGGEQVEDAWMGEGKREVGPEDIRRALRLYLAAGAVLFALVAALAAIWSVSI